MSEVKMTESMKAALKDCAQFDGHGYFWKPKTMEKLATLGLVEKYRAVARIEYGDAYRITPAGRTALGQDKEGG